MGGDSVFCGALINNLYIMKYGCAMLGVSLSEYLKQGLGGDFNE